MQREIKFRAWDEKRKTMWEVDCLNWYDEYMWVNESPMSGDKLPIGSTPIMQFTGLLDRHGVEIYEGDLVRHSLRATPLPVGFSEGSFVYIDDKAGLSISCDVWEEREVIGNIYEHSHLLEATQ